MKKFFFAILLITSSAFARPEVSIPASVEISQRPLLRLGDIATVTGGSDELLTFLDSIIIREDARELLLSQHLQSQEILNKVREAMKSEVRLKELNPTFMIPSQVQVAFAAEPISKQEVERKIYNTLKVRCPDCEYKISLQRIPVPNGKTWEMDLTQMTTKGGLMIPLREDGSSGVLGVKWISGTIRVLKLTPVTTRLIQQGERLQNQDMRMEMTDITFAKDGALSVADIAGQLAARSLPVGSPLWSSDLKREPAAKRGQIVKGLLGDDSFEITVSLQAEDNGFVGDLIRVKNTETQKILSGLIVEKGVVKLQ
ncbi:MAG: flagellar basal body P-ring formation protein FlgA [Bdellovibrio sp.]|nr:flagellar basal body P-ring formation protein FlgA [Bdellovibrio sp.]